MKKKLPFLLALLLLAATGEAQLLRRGGTLRLKPSTAADITCRPAMTPPWHSPRRDAIALTDDQMWWGYYMGESNLIGLGTSTAESYDAAIAIDPWDDLVEGKSIRAVRFVVAGTAYMKNFHVWINETLPGLADVLPSVSVPVEASKLVDNGLTEVELPTPYAIGDKPLYVGISFDITEAGGNLPSNYPLLVTYDGTNIPGATLLHTSERLPEWTDPATTEEGYGKLAMQVLLEGDFPHNAIEPEATFNDVYALPGSTVEATLTLVSRGLGEVSSIDYIVDEANISHDEQHLDITPFSGMNAQQTVRIPLTADPTTGRSPRFVTITKVNGEENAVNNATSKGYCVTLSKAVPRKTVVEEFTGTWCGWCPIGITGLEKLQERLADKVLIVAVHADDPMSIDYGASAPSYPYAMVDRGTPAHPYYGISGQPEGICELAEQMNTILSEASVELQQPTLNKNGSVSFKTEVTFNYSDSRSNYAIGYVLLADGLKGSGRQWAQANYYCAPDTRDDYADDPALDRWTKGDSYMQLTYDHVPIAAKGMDGGLSGSISAPIVDGQTRTLSNSFALTGNTILQDFDHLSVAAVLFNTQTGTIVNADIRPVTIAEDFAVNRMQVKNFSPTTVLRSTASAIDVPVANFGKAGIHSIDYTVRAQGQESQAQHLELQQPITTYGIYTPVSFPIDAPDQTGYANQTITITAVNGQENEATAGKTSTGSVTTIAQSVPRKTVVEEYTGTWCMWCPRGLAALKRASIEYPDEAILMSIHSGSGSTVDPMQVSAFASQIAGRSFPSADVNRYRPVDPYMGEQESGWGLGAVIEDEQQHLAEASVELDQPILDPQTGIITFQTDVTFQLNRRSAPYLLSYVLVADGLTGTDPGWTQTNIYAYFAGSYDDDPYMKEVTEWPLYTEGLVYDHVAIAQTGISTGISGSLSSTVEEGQVQTHQGRFNIKNNSLATKATRLSVIALLYDKNRKCFVNADQKVVLSADDDAVSPTVISEDYRHAQRYTIDGRITRRTTPGIHLLRTPDGRIRKVAVAP